MEKPELGDGHSRIANEVLEALSKINLSSYQSRLLFAVLRKTYGFGKKEDYISLSQLVEMTSIKESHVSRAKAQLIERKIVTYTGNKIGLNKYYSQWCDLPIQGGSPNPGKKLTNLGQDLPIQGDTKETKQKKYINTSNEVFVDPPRKPSYGNENINKILLALKGKIQIEDFRESNPQQRIWGSNLYKLMEKISPQEFARRLAVVLADDFKRKNCNSLQFIYKEIKAFVEPKSNFLQV